MTFSQALVIVDEQYRDARLSPVYWDRGEYDCTPESSRIMVSDAVHLHAASDRAACLNLLAYRLEYESTVRASGYAPDPRYRCLAGPGGLIRGVTRDGRGVSDLWGPR